jgi:hypothetical protein
LSLDTGILITLFLALTGALWRMGTFVGSIKTDVHAIKRHSEKRDDTIDEHSEEIAKHGVRLDDHGRRIGVLEERRAS